MSLLKLLRFERLESRRLLAVVWANEFVTDPLSPDYPRFNMYDDNEVFARAIVNQAISDWNEVITNFNYAEDADSDPNNDFDNTFTLRILAGQISNPTARGQTFQFDYLHTNSEGKPITASILLDDNAGETGWFFDQTPEDDVEFAAIGSPFLASFVDVDGQMTRLNDFYRTIAHEIGHALGINTNLSALQNMLSLNGHEDEVHREEGASDPTDLKTFVSTRANPQFGVQATFTGSHLYEGHANDAPDVLVHPQELMNLGRTSPAGNNPAETARAFISDLTVKILADVYGYTVTLPSELNTTHAMLDSLTGTLLVQGSARNFTTGAGVNDAINLQRVINGQDDNILVTVNDTAERIPFAQVKDIIIHGNGGTDTITVNPNVTQPWQQVQYVVSSNQDALEISTGVGGASTTNGIVDLISVIPGSQTTLRAAIIEANSAGGARGIYVGRGIYNLTLNGTGGDTQGDLDITGNMTIVGAGAGATIINAGTLTARDRVFEINGANRSLNLARVTVTGGNTSAFPGSTGIGGGISVIGAGAGLTVTDSAVVGNAGKSFGGGIYSQGTTTITRSVLAGNHLASSSLGGGGIYASSGTVSLGSTIVANNTATIGPQDISGTDPYWASQGNNLLTSIQSPLVDNFSQPGDYVGSVNYIVTSVVDSFDHADDAGALSLREAVDLANTNDGTPETIWLPAWNLVLTRERTGGVGTTEMDVAFGDLDITDKLNVRGVSAALTQVQWKAGVIDAVLDLAGDYDGNGLTDGPDGGGVDGRDQLIHGRQFGATNGIGRGQSSADGDDDGDVDGDDLIVWQNNYGNWLVLINVTPILA